ncbi:MAG: nucleoside hydrolase, partial [Bacteroidetes bacterium]|nr:nucleoside hydrolase [Bacteroidota bacterium]
TMLYKKPVAKIQARTIEDHGLIEWKATVLTNEIHGHTGIYSIIGVKMGIRACEYFNVGINNLQVISLAGKKPPLSCLNDGIQISTGATIGQGLIEISDTICTIPTAIFEFNKKRITINLKEALAQKIQEDIKKGVQLYSFSEQYWLYIEELALQYWANYDRHAIFEIEKL